MKAGTTELRTLREVHDAPREHAGSLADLAQVFPDIYWEQDEACRFTLLAGRGLGPAGIDPEQLLGSTLWDGGEAPLGHSGSWNRHWAALEARQPFVDFVFTRVSSRGELRHLSASGQPVLDEAGRFAGYRGTMRDITQSVQMELRLAIERAVSRVLESCGSIAEAAPKIIRAICEALGWACGVRWAADESQGVRCAETWGVASPGIEAFLDAMRQRMTPGDAVGGLKRRVRAERRPMWIPDVTRDATFRRAPEALSAGLHSAFAFPIKAGEQLLGVMEFFSRAIHQPDAELLDCMSYVGSQIGQFLQRKQAEEVVRESEARFRSLTKLSSDFYWESDAAHRIVDTQYGPGHRPLVPNSQRLGRARWELPSTHPDATGWAEHRATMDAFRPFRDFEFARIDADGIERHVSISGEPMFDSSGGFKGYRGIGKDITERKRDERLLNLEHAVTRCLAEAEGVSSALKAVMRAVCETKGWECGRYFRKDQDGLFRFGEAWHAQGAEMDAFIAYSADKAFAPGVGIVGRAGAGEPIWVANLAQDARVVSRPMAIDHGMRAAFMFPVLSGGSAIGVLSFTSRELREPDSRLLRTATVIGSQIGQFLQRKQAEAVLRESEERFRSLTLLSSDLYWEQDDQFCFTSFSGMGAEGAGKRSTLPSLGKRRWEQNYLNMTPEAWAGHIAALEAHQPFRDLELCRLDPAGNKVWISISGEPVFDAAGAFKGYRGVGKDITGRKLAEERIQYLANHDALTSLPNRAMFSEVLNLAILSARRHQRGFAVLFIDLDRFKVINDTLGHEAGDRLLKEMSARLTHTMRSSDVVARLGGDEFVVLAQEVDDAKQAETLARKLIGALVKPATVRGQEYRVTASIGICMYPSDAQDEQALMKNADIAMYRAKEQGKNTYKFYSAESDLHSLERLALETSLRRGLERGEFFLHYQPRLELPSGRITGVEALLRWQHPELGMVPPAQFIPLAEETGLVAPIGRWVLRTACGQNMAWQRAGLPALRMSVNISARQFLDEDLVKEVRQALEESGMRPELLELELTESMVMQSPGRAASFLAAVKLMGVRLAVDDFGVGYSSLAHLRRFPIDTLKVDRSFIREIPHNQEDRAIMEAIIAMAKSLHLTVVAEGVETLEQQSFLREHACDEMQGYYFSEPLAADRLARMLRQRVGSSRDGIAGPME